MKNDNKNTGIIIILLGLLGIITSLASLLYTTIYIFTLIIILGIWTLIPSKFDFSRKYSHTKEHSEKTNG